MHNVRFGSKADISSHQRQPDMALRGDERPVGAERQSGSVKVLTLTASPPILTGSVSCRIRDNEIEL